MGNIPILKGTEGRHTCNYDTCHYPGDGQRLWERGRGRDYFWPRGTCGGLREENALELSAVAGSILQREVAGRERHGGRENGV